MQNVLAKMLPVAKWGFFNAHEGRARKHELIAAADNLVKSARNSGQDLKGDALKLYDGIIAEVTAIEAKLINNVDAGIVLGGQAPQTRQTTMSEEYTQSFLAFLRSGGKQATAALSEGFDQIFGGFRVPALTASSSGPLYKGSNPAGGYAVSVPTDPQIVPLGLPDLGVRSAARVIQTATDVKIPTQTAFGTAGIKAESGASTNTFVESDRGTASMRAVHENR